MKTYLFNIPPLSPYWAGFWSCGLLVFIIAVIILALAISTAKRGPEDGE